MVRNDYFKDLWAEFNFAKQGRWHRTQRFFKEKEKLEQDFEKDMKEYEVRFKELEAKFNAGVPENHPLLSESH